MSVHHFKTSAPFAEPEASCLILVTANWTLLLTSLSQFARKDELLKARAKSFLLAA